MITRLVLVFFSLSLALTSAYAERLKVHPSEQAAMDALIQGAGIDESLVSSGGSERQIHEFDEYFLTGTRYFYDDVSSGQPALYVSTNPDGHVVRLEYDYVKYPDFEQILKFKKLRMLIIRFSSLEKIPDISSLNELMYLRVAVNDKLIDFNGINNLSNLKFFRGSGNSQSEVKIVGGVKNLPSLEEFYCETCVIPDISFLESAKNLKILKIGMLGSTLDPLKDAKKMEEIKIRSDNLKDASAINNMKNLNSLMLWDTNIESLDIGPNLTNLKELRLGNSPLKSIPQISHLRALESLSIAGTNIRNIDKIHDLPELTRLVLTRNNTKRIVNLKNLPKLKELYLADQPLEYYETGVLPSLKELDLSKTNIKKLTGFENFPNLTNLKLYDTKVKSVRGIEKSEHLEYVQTDHTLPDSAENDAVFQEMKENRQRRFRERFGKYLD
ncbi:leucine-rich repeat domain-containing protein [Bermanella marisrubri]|uniref:Internalin A n=1 Tax=Bermanella marisrubri TaxID=207949 RepID=Q1N4Z6_9GAMM|nr:leucine-rich repeat domain-containing protein [Bermanella marisrubri]EAT13282.1 internalin A [Oceanobacter sp. RED65] [Bermanella marisrubri]QIZ84045.1 leucine-rich repeat domain-containing protein [Bermanella marisrubri]